jgi:hypothetical protein
MIAKMKSNRGLKATIDYNLKDESELIDVHNLIGSEIQDYQRQMEITQRLFEGRAKNLTAHIILSPAIDDGSKLNKSDWKEIALQFLQKAKLDKNESIVFLHTDKEHYHLHIVANRINDDGKIYRNGSELHLSQRIGNEIAAERGMKQAGEIMLEKNKNRHTKSPGLFSGIKQDLLQASNEVKSKHGKFLVTEYFTLLIKTGYDVKIFLKNVGKAINFFLNGLTFDIDLLRGYGVKKDGKYYNASQLGEEYTLNALTKPLVEDILNVQQPVIEITPQPKVKKSKASRLKGKNKIVTDQKMVIALILKRILIQQFKDVNEYVNAINEHGLIVHLHMRKETGELRGYSLEKDGQIFNASDIGREFSIKNLGRKGIIGNLHPPHRPGLRNR